MVKARQTIFLAVILGLMTTRVDSAPPPKIALQGGRIIPVVGSEVAEGTLLIENGTITAIGPQVEIPYDAMVIDVSGKVLFPGMIVAHTSGGMDRANENLAVTPYLDVYDSIDPSSLFFEDALRDGLLALHISQGNSCVIGGVTRLVHPIGRTTDEMTIRPSIALKLSTSPKGGYDRMTQMATMREAFSELAYYLENLAEQRYEAEAKKNNQDVDVTPSEAREKGSELIRDEDLDDKHRNLVRLTEGRLGGWVYCGAAQDVGPAIRTAKENGFLDRAVFVLGTDAYLAAEELKQVGRPVVLPPELVHRERHPITGELKETFVPRKIRDAGLQFALVPSSSSSLAERYLTYQAASCVREGIPRQAALEAITINAARMLGVEDRLGSLEVGKAGYVVVFSGDPLDFNSWVEQAYIRGVLAYDRAEDVRLKELMGLQKRAADKAAAEAKPTKPKPAAKQDASAEKDESGETDPTEKPTGEPSAKPAPKTKKAVRKQDPKSDDQAADAAAGDER